VSKQAVLGESFPFLSDSCTHDEPDTFALCETSVQTKQKSFARGATHDPSLRPSGSLFLVCSCPICRHIGSNEQTTNAVCLNRSSVLIKGRLRTRQMELRIGDVIIDECWTCWAGCAGDALVDAQAVRVFRAFSAVQPSRRRLVCVMGLNAHASIDGVRATGTIIL